MSDEKCLLCGEPMPPGEQMFNYHGYSGPCPKPPLTATARVFHAKDGLCFARLESGDVRVSKRQSSASDAPLILDETIPADVWASVMASMSAAGEAATIDKAKELHKGPPPNPPKGASQIYG